MTQKARQSPLKLLAVEPMSRETSLRPVSFSAEPTLTKQLNLRWVISSAAVAALIACGGGGGGGSASSSISGVAATGAPVANAPVYLKDSTGAEPPGQNEAAGVALVTTDDSGAYAFPESAIRGLQPPFIVRVVGTKVLDSGDDATAILHAVVPSAAGSTANLTPLTEAATILTLGTDTASAFEDPQVAVASYTEAAASNANAALLAALPIPEGIRNIDLVSGALDAQPKSDLSNPGAAKLHDMLLDSFEFSTSQGKLVLSDRNRSEDQLVGGPQVVISAATAQSGVTTTGGPMEGVNTDGILDSAELEAFIDRFNAQLKSGCSVPLLGTYNATCANVVDPIHGVFSSAYKHTGMTADKWLSAWVATPLDVEDLSDVTVSLRAAYRGSFLATPGQRVTRVALKFARPNGDHVIRTLLLADEGTSVTVFGNQKDYFLSVRPRLTVNTDADDTYPFNPRYQVGVQFILKHWYAGAPNMILGAHIDGPGLPVGRASFNGHTRGIELFQRTDTSAGCSNMAIDPRVYVEKNTRTWDAAWGAYKLSQYDRGVLFDGQVRWKEGNLTCDPTFDMRRYYSSAEIASLSLPRRGDTYTVTLYLDATKWGGIGQPALPAGAGALVSGVVNADGEAVSYFPLVVSAPLHSDAFSVPTDGDTISASVLPGVTDATRQRLLTYARGDDRLVEWTRNRVSWPERDASGNPTVTHFGNFVVGVFTSAKDQMSTNDSGYVAMFNTASPPLWSDPTARGFKDYREFFTTTANPAGHLTIDASGVSSGRLDLDCGSTAAYKGSTVRVRVRKVTNLRTGDTNDRVYEEVSCASANVVTGAQTTLLSGNRTVNNWYWVGTGSNAFFRNTNSGSTETIRYQYDVVRDRVNFQSDKSTLVAANQLRRAITWAQMMAKEKAGSQALCSSMEGAWAYRKAYVILADMNGRQIQEAREVSADLPGMSASELADGSVALATRYTSETDFLAAIGGTANYLPPITRAIDVFRPNYLIDAVYLPLSMDVSAYDLSWTSAASTYAWNPGGSSSHWHAQPGVVQPAYEKASASATSCTPVAY